MRTRFILFAALLVLSLAFLGWAHVTVSAAKDAVVLEETVLEGDPAAAAGIRVDMRAACLDHLFWETRLVAGPERTTHTDYTYTLNEVRYRQPWEPGGLQLDFWGNSGITRDYETEDERGMQKPFNDVASRCPPGTEDYTEWVDLADYYTDFPIYILNADLIPGDTSLYLPEDRDSIDLQVQRELRRCFPISVPEGSFMEIRMDKSSDGKAISSYGYSFPENVQEPEVCSVVTDKGCYFTLSNPTRTGESKLDTSRFVPGYGVYFLPVELAPAPEEIAKAWKEEVMTAQVGAVSRVYPIDPAADYALLYASGDKSRLYLVTQTGGDCVLTVLDAADGSEVARLALFEVTPMGEETPYLRNVILRDGLLMPYLSDGRFAVVTEEGNDYEIALTGSLDPVYENGLYLSYTGGRRGLELPALDFDGERLAVADVLDYPAACSFFLAVYGQDGLEFLGAYSSSLDRSGGRGNNCEPAEPDPLTVRLP